MRSRRARRKYIYRAAACFQRTFRPVRVLLHSRLVRPLEFLSGEAVSHHEDCLDGHSRPFLAPSGPVKVNGILQEFLVVNPPVVFEGQGDSRGWRDDAKTWRMIDQHLASTPSIYRLGFVHDRSDPVVLVRPTSNSLTREHRVWAFRRRHQ